MSEPSGLTGNSYTPRRGDIVWIDFDPIKGHEQAGTHPALILSSGLMTKRTGLAIVCPITSKVKGFPFEIKINQSKIKGAILPIHARSVDVMARGVVFAEKCSSEALNTTTQAIETMIGVA